MIITVDCGSTSVAEVAESRTRAASTSSSPTTTASRRSCPAALAIVNPHRPDATYPDRRLAGSGVAFKVAQLLLADEPGGPAAALDLDRPGDDRVRRGRGAGRRREPGDRAARASSGCVAAPRPGIAALLERARVAPAAVDLETVSFAIAPRLNAAGRVGEALEAARLLLADDPAEAAAHADALEAANLTRRDLMKTAVGRGADGRRRREPGRTARRSCAGRGRVGIVGLVAARLVEDRGRPAVVGADLGDVVRASCRSDGSLDLGATLERCADLFIRFGGHAGAAGFEIATDRWDEFRERFLALAAESRPAGPAARRSRSTSRCPRSTSTTRSTASWPGSRRAARATPTRSSPSSA